MMTQELPIADARARMILGQVRTNDVQDAAVIDAMASLPRENFVPPNQRHLAYADACVPLKPGRFLLDPRTLAKMLQAARIERHERVLDIASGTGYSTAVLCQLSEDVVTLEEDQDLAAQAAKDLSRMPKLGTLFGAIGPHNNGYAAKGPYDVMVVNGAVTSPPHAWARQLREGGRLIAPVSHGPLCKVQLFVHSGGTLSGRNVFDATVPLLPGFEAAASFSF